MSVNYFLQEKFCAEIQRDLDLDANLVSHCTKFFL